MTCDKPVEQLAHICVIILSYRLVVT